MNVLLLGNGGREDALSWKITQSPLCQNLWIAPGNAGTKRYGTNVDLSITDFTGIRSFIETNDIQLLIVGPEAPLCEGIVNELADIPELKIIGPDKEAAKLEGSKAYAKAFMQKYGIPTASYKAFTKENQKEAHDYILSHALPIVLKADGLAAGKGVLILNDHEEALKEFNNMIEGKFGDAGARVVIEEFLDGIEYSVFALTDGKNYKLLPTAKDYKRIGEGDQGLNTGGMGSVSPVSFIDDVLMKRTIDEIIEPTINGIADAGLNYKGIVFFGIINVEGAPKVIEYNCRFGDPETQSIVPRINIDLLDLFDAVGTDRFNDFEVTISDDYSCSVVLVSGGYPEKYEKNIPISGLDQVEGAKVFHAGTKVEGTQILTNGGRVMAINSVAATQSEALNSCYENAKKIQFEKSYYRKDIGFDL